MCKIIVLMISNNPGKSNSRVWWIWRIPGNLWETEAVGVSRQVKPPKMAMALDCQVSWEARWSVESFHLAREFQTGTRNQATRWVFTENPGLQVDPGNRVSTRRNSSMWMWQLEATGGLNPQAGTADGYQQELLRRHRKQRLSIEPGTGNALNQGVRPTLPQWGTSFSQ